jgi:hypothetical protein
VKHHLSKHSLHAVYATLTFVLASVILLWSWNTLSVLLDGPIAQYKHAVAALALAYIVGRVMAGAVGHGHRVRLQGPNGGV